MGLPVTASDIHIAKKNGICEGTLRTRLNRGWNKERALTKPVETERARWLKVAKKRGISEKVFDYRIYYKGMSHKKAALTPLRRYRKVKK